MNALVRILLAAPVALLSACIFGDEEDRSFRVGFETWGGDRVVVREHGDTVEAGFGTEYSAEYDSSVTQGEWNLGYAGTLALMPESRDPWWFERYDPADDSAQLEWETNGPLWNEKAPTLILRHDSVGMGTLRAILSGFVLKDPRRYEGMPCAFSGFKGLVWDSAGRQGLPIAVKNVAFRKAHGHLRLTALIDSAASMRLSPQADLDANMYISMRVSCP